MAKVRKFADGGSDRYKARMERKTADIESDYKKALAKGKNADIAKAKYEQRKADAADDFAKWTKADRTGTRAAESAAKSALKEARRTDGRSIQMRDTLAKMDKPLESKIDVASTLKGLSAPSLTTTKKATAPVRKAAPKAVTPTRKTAATPPPPPPPPPAGSRTNPFPANKKEDVVVTGKKRDYNTISRESRNNFLKNINPFRWAARGIDAALTAGTGPSKPEKPDTGKAAALAKNKDRVARLRAAGNERDAKFYEKYPTAMKKGGNVKKYAGGGSVPPQPTAAERAASKRQDEALKKVKVSTKEGRVISSANRSEGSAKRFAKGGVTKEMPTSKQMGDLNMAKGGMAKAKAKSAAKGKPFAATKFGAAMVKKSADTKGRAMPKFAKGGSVDGIAQRGKTRCAGVHPGAKMARGGMMKKGGSC